MSYESLWCPFAFNSEIHLIGGAVPAPVVINRNPDGSAPDWAKCLGPQCALWNDEDERCGLRRG